MDRKIHKIIIITGYPFNRRDYDRFGIEYFRSKELEVEIWDISAILSKNVTDQLPVKDPTLLTDLRIFKKKEEIVKAILSIDNNSIINCFIEYSPRTVFIFRTISKQKIRYCVVEMASFPNPFPVQEWSIHRITQILKKAGSLKVPEIIGHILNKIQLNYYSLFGIAPASIVILGGERSSAGSSYPVDKATTRVWTHSFDYDIFLKNESETGDSHTGNGIFLDQYLPFHPEYHYFDVKPISPEKYYPGLCNFFTLLEKNMNSRIVIAAHPRSDYPDLPDYFCGRSIIKGETARLIRDSSFVIAHSSTAINFAILYRKPVLFLTTDELQKKVSGMDITGLFIPAIAAELGKLPINIDHTSGFSWEREMSVDTNAYLRYKNNYIKKEGTPEKYGWEIFYSCTQ